VATPGATLLDIHNRAAEVLKAGLLTLGLITDPSGDQWRLWFTHGTSHYLGLDVHDVGARTWPLRPGAAFVIEPGLYIRQSALDALPRTPENTAFIEKVGPVVRKYNDIGIRIEDAFILDESGLRHVTASLPRTVEEIEAFMAAR
jgi:Xaa-Pro aminopeptidase